MTIDSIDIDLENVFSLGQWLESEDAVRLQKHLEEKIMGLLFNYDPAGSPFQKMVTELAWIGARPEARPLLEREIITLNFPNNDSVEQCGLWKEVDKVRHKIGKAGREVGHFVADHAVEIAVGAAICATGIGIAVATGYTCSAVVGGVVVAGAGSIFQPEEKPNPHIPQIPFPDPKACSKVELAAIQQGLPITLPKIALPSSVNELLVTADGIWANGQFFSTHRLMEHSSFTSTFRQNNPEENNRISPSYTGADWKSFTYYSQLSEQLSLETNGSEISYQTRGENALALGNYSQAVQDFAKTIEEKPNNHLAYLERGAAHFGLGQYDSSLQDYQQFLSQDQTTYPLSVSEFSIGFAKGLPKGVYESGAGALLFLSDFVKHPIQTSKQVIDSITTLVNLVHKDEWGTIAKALSPELHQLVDQWDTIPSEQRGKLAGYALGKHGADILVPGALAKIASKSAKSAQELVAICKNIQIAQETLVLETAAGIGNSVKIAEVVRSGQTMMALGKDAGLTAQEIKKAYDLGTTYKGLKAGQEKFLGDSVVGLENGSKIAEIIQLEKRISEWIGEGTKLIRNEAGDPVLISKDGLRKVRFDFNRPKPHENPHMHLEEFNGEKWQDMRIFPEDVPHN